MLAFNKLSEKYKLPKYIDDIQSDKSTFFKSYNTSVYEQLGKLKFLEDEIYIKNHVLMAIYLVKNKLEINLDEKLIASTGNKEILGFGYKGKDIEVEMIPVKKGESWFELGCDYFIKEV